MTRPSTPPILTELRSPSTPASQVAALRALKNEIIGHEQKKELWIGLGIVTPIVRILNSSKGIGKRKSREVNGTAKQKEKKAPRTDEEEARLQAIIILGSLAQGGPAFIPPLLSGFVLQPLLSILLPGESAPPLVHASLRTLNTIADSLSLLDPSNGSTDQTLASLLFSAPYAGALTQTLWQSNPSTIIVQQITLAANLISKLCQEEWQRVALVEAGALDALATRMASFVVSMGLVLPRAEAQQDSSEGPDRMPPPAPADARLGPILEAIGTVIQFSKSRASQLIHSPALLTVFPRASVEVSPSYDRRPTGASFPTSSGFVHQIPMNPIDYLLPHIPVPHHRGASAQSSSFPPLGAAAPPGRHTRTGSGLGWAIETRPADTSAIEEDEESALVSWLIYVTRTQTGMTSLLAAWVLTMLYRSGLTNKRRETSFALLLVPLLVRMLGKDYRSNREAASAIADRSSFQTSTWCVKEQAPMVLAMLVMDSPELQKAAVDADAIKKLSQLLKESYDPLPKLSQSSMWNPDGADSYQNRDSSSVSRLGPPGLSPLASYILKMREGVLMALAAIAPFKDEYRKAIIDNGVVPFIIESLKPYDKSLSASSKGNGSATMPNGNPVPVLLAACAAARALSRSVSILRTSLIDAGIAVPLFVLLKHQDMEVQIAATAVVCNLVLEFSPMREAIVDAGVLKVLCDHAHSMNAKLRLNSLWALKHLVYMTPNDVKMACLDQLGPGWLKQAICNDTDDVPSTSGSRGDDSVGTATPIAMSTPNAAGEQVDLLNAVEESRESTPAGDGGEEDGEDEGDDEDGDMKMADSSGPFDIGPKGPQLPRTSNGRVLSSGADSIRGRHCMPSESGSKKFYSSDYVAIQEQGLDFMRNLICGPGAAEMIDHLFHELGQDKLFEILASKLRPRTVNTSSNHRRENKRLHSLTSSASAEAQFTSNANHNGAGAASGIGSKYVQTPPPEILISTVHVISHIAAGSPRHRQLLIAQTELLRSLVALFEHPNRNVRSCCAWVVINLTWVDDQSDEGNCKARAMELRKLGVLGKLESLEADPELDVRERVKTAISQMGRLLH